MRKAFIIDNISKNLFLLKYFTGILISRHSDIFYQIEGKLHREDGPAVTYGVGINVDKYFLFGKQISNRRDWERQVYQIKK